MKKWVFWVGVVLAVLWPLLVLGQSSGGVVKATKTARLVWDANPVEDGVDGYLVRAEGATRTNEVRVRETNVPMTNIVEGFPNGVVNFTVFAARGEEMSPPSEVLPVGWLGPLRRVFHVRVEIWEE